MQFYRNRHAVLAESANVDRSHSSIIRSLGFTYFLRVLESVLFLVASRAFNAGLSLFGIKCNTAETFAVAFNGKIDNSLLSKKGARFGIHIFE